MHGGRRVLFMAVVALALVPMSPVSGVVSAPWPAASLGDATAQMGASDEAGDIVPGEILVRFNTPVHVSSVQIAARLSATRARVLDDSEVEVWTVPVGQERSLAARLTARSDVAYAEPNYIYRAFGLPDDPSLGKQWAHTIINSAAAWDIETGSATVIIAILDTGIDENHPDLESKMVTGRDFVDNDADPHDTNGHGTHVAGIAAAVTNNGTGIAGMDWNARIMPIRVLGTNGFGSSTDLVSGIIWARQHGARILNLSLGSPDYSQAVQDAVNSAHAAGLLVVAAMGNIRSTNPTNYPAALDHVVAVAATGNSDTYAPYSQYGAYCDIAAPGGVMTTYHDPGGIYSTLPTYACYFTDLGYSQNYDYLRGTSQAAPFVSGLAALIWAEDPSLTPDEVQDVIETTAVDLDPPGWDPNYGHGRINAAAALQAISAPDPVMDLQVSQAVTDTGTLTATLTWTPPADAMTTTLRYATAAITKDTWESATVLSDTVPAGTGIYTARVPNGATAFFALKSQGATGSWSQISNPAFWPFRLVFVPLVIRAQ